MGRLRLVLLGLALLMAAALLLRPMLFRPRAPVENAIAPIERPSPPPVVGVAPPAAVAPDALSAALERAPDYRRFFDRLRAVFPADYERVAEAAAAPKGDLNIDAALSDAVRRVRQTRGVLAAKASNDALARVFEQQLDVLKRLESSDKKLCVDFLYSGASEGLAAFSAQNRGAIADMALAGLDAIADGQDARIERGPPSDEDFAALETALTGKGVEKPIIDALLDGRSPEPAVDDARMCAAGRIYLETLRELPEEIRMRIYALAVELMARS